MEDIADLEKALAAVKARSLSAADKERGYLSRIAQLEEANKALTAKLAGGEGAGGGEGDGGTPSGATRPMGINNNSVNNGGGEAAAVPSASVASSPGKRDGEPRGSFGRKSSFTSMRTKSHHLTAGGCTR